MNAPMKDARERRDMMDELLNVTERLTEIVAAETAMLRRDPPRELAPIAEDKSRMVVRYDTLVRQLAERQPGVTREELRATRLADAIARLTEHAKDNAAAIEIHLKATRRVLDMIARAAQKAAEPNFSYGTERLGYGARSARPSAVAINRVL